MSTDRDLERVLAGLVERVERRYYGKYRGFVVHNDDPRHLGRLQLRVPGLLGEDVVTGWATPCLPYGGAPDQGFLFVPEVDAGVWVEFEQGDLEFPIWVGTFWTGDQLPKPVGADGADAEEIQDPPTSKIIKTRKGHTILLEDADGAELVLIREGSAGQLVTLSPDGIRIADAAGNSIELTGDAMTLTAAVPFTIDAAGQPVKIIGDSIDLAKG